MKFLFFLFLFLSFFWGSIAYRTHLPCEQIGVFGKRFINMPFLVSFILRVFFHLMTITWGWQHFHGNRVPKCWLLVDIDPSVPQQLWLQGCLPCVKESSLGSTFRSESRLVLLQGPSVRTPWRIWLHSHGLAHFLTVTEKSNFFVSFSATLRARKLSGSNMGGTKGKLGVRMSMPLPEVRRFANYFSTPLSHDFEIKMPFWKGGRDFFNVGCALELNDGFKSKSRGITGVTIRITARQLKGNLTFFCTNCRVLLSARFCVWDGGGLLERATLKT